MEKEDAMTEDRMTLQEEYSKLLLFFNWAIQESFEGTDLSGADIQAQAIALGLAKGEPYDPKVHGLATHCEEGDRWVRLLVDRYGVPPLPLDCRHVGP
jgi:hypothetical protein